MTEPAEGSLWKSEQLVLCQDERIGLRAAIAINDTTLGPGLGGVRCVKYPSAEAAVTEAQRLAAAMTLKNASAGLPYGGAKSVILAPDPSADRAAVMRRFGDFIARTGGAYLPGVDMGTSVEDLALMGESGADVSCSEEDPSPWTALGVAAAVRATVAHMSGRDPDESGLLDGVRVLVQGAGHVGAALAQDLADDGAVLLIADVNAPRAEAVAEAVDGHVVGPDEVIGIDCDVYAPCAVARVVNPRRVSTLRCRAIVGAANDTLSSDADADLLASHGILYVPDFIANAGGVIHIHALRAGRDEVRLRSDITQIGGRVHELLDAAVGADKTPLAMAIDRVDRILSDARRHGAPTRHREVLHA